MTNISRAIFAGAFSIVSLSIPEIARSTEPHQIDTIQGWGHGAFCGIMGENNKEVGDILNFEQDKSVSMKIDGQIVKFNLVSTRKINKKRNIAIYNESRFKLKIDSTDVSTPKEMKNCGQTFKEVITISNSRWKKVVTLKVGCDPCG